MTVSERTATTPRALRTAGQVAGWFTVLALVALLAAVFVVPRVAGAETFTVLSGSMRPTLDPGDLVVVRTADPEQIGVGSVVTFQTESGDPAVTTHRVVSQGVNEDGGALYLTRGDGNESADPVWIKDVQLRGTVWYSVPYVGFLAKLMPQGLRETLAGLVGGMLLVYALVMFTTGIRDRRGAHHA